MEHMNILIIINFLLIIIISFLLILFLIRNRIFRVMSKLIYFFFFLFLLLDLSVIFTPKLYNYGVNQVLKISGTTSTIEQIDKYFTIEKYTEETTDIYNEILDFLGLDNDWNKNNDSKQKTDNTSMNETPSLEKEGPLMSILYPKIEGLLSLIIKTATILFSTIGMLLITYISYTLQGFQNSRILENEIKILKKRVETLESKL